MHSSIFSSKTGSSSKTAIAALLLVALGIYALGEAAARFGLNHSSQIHERIMGEERAAKLIRHSQPPSVLITGNSLLLHGIDFPRLAAETKTDLRASRFVVESTQAFDWYFAYKNLFRHRVHPDAIILCLPPQHLLPDAIRGDFSARFLFGLADIWPASRASHADLTTTSSLYFAHFSSFFGARSELRAVLAGRATPSVPQMWISLNNRAAPEYSDQQIYDVCLQRFRMFKQLCDGEGTRFMAMIPPTAMSGEGAEVRAGKDAGVTVLHPIPNYSLDSSYYLDGFHLSPKGADVFTTAVVRELNAMYAPGSGAVGTAVPAR